MKKCLKCDRSNIRDVEKYCPNCGSRELEVVHNINPPPIADAKAGLCSASSAARIGAFSIDFAGLFILALLTPIPGLGLLAALFAFLYQLLRDAKGASFGKTLLHLKIVTKSGGKPSTKQCIVRNLIFVAPYLLLFIPGMVVIGEPLALLIYCIELIALLSTGQRIGDRMAGTSVVKN